MCSNKVCGRLDLLLRYGPNEFERVDCDKPVVYRLALNQTIQSQWFAFGSEDKTVSVQDKTKLNQLLQAVPRNGVVTTVRLRELGVSPQLARKYVQNGWLQRLGVGAFARAGESPDWLGGIHALQSQLSMTVHVAAVSALELQGRAHFIPLGSGRRVTLVSDRKESLPKWFTTGEWTVTPHHRCVSLFDTPPSDNTTQFDCGGFSVLISTPERAILEELYFVQSNNALEHAVLLMEGLSTLRPSILQQSLVSCRSVKAKRLLLWSGERCQHTWMKRLDLTSVNLGTGKRQVFKGGVLDPKYLITVPQPEELPSV